MINGLSTLFLLFGEFLCLADFDALCVFRIDGRLIDYAQLLACCAIDVLRHIAIGELYADRIVIAVVFYL